MPQENSQLRSEEILTKRSDLLAHRKKAIKTQKGIQVLTFDIGSDRYGLRISQLIGVKKVTNISILPGTFAGSKNCRLMTVQGNVYTLFHLSSPTQANYALLLTSKERLKLGLFADAFDSIVEISEDEAIDNNYLIPKIGNPFMFLELKSVLENSLNRESKI